MNDARQEVVTQLLALIPELRRRFQTSLPAELTAELCGGTPHQLEALHMLAQQDGSGRGATMNELARWQHCALSTATALVDRLVQQGLAERVSNPDDRRVVWIVPTDRARVLLGKFVEAKRQMVLAALWNLDDAELDTLVTLLNKVLTGGTARAEVVNG